jgi:hypothetical protein
MAENPVGREERKAFEVKAATDTLQECLRAFQGFRNHFTGRFIIREDQNVSATGATALLRAECGIAVDGTAGIGHSNPTSSKLLTINEQDGSEPGFVQQPGAHMAPPVAIAQIEDDETVQSNPYQQPEENSSLKK